MGNQPSNDDFSKSGNFDMNKHKQAMAHLSSNYSVNGNLALQSGLVYRPQVTET